MAEQCITLPPITLTGPKTAAEKQIIGEQNELEEDVWMISSAKVTSGAKIKSKKNQKAQTKEETVFAEQAFAILYSFSEELEQLKSDGVIGENKDGLLSNLLSVSEIELPEEVRKEYAPPQAGNQENANEDKSKPWRTLVKTVEEVNKARLLIAKSYIINQQKAGLKLQAEPAEIIRSYRENYHNQAKKGEYIQNDDGTWEKK